jgi:alpha-L-fucosidase
MDTEKVAAASLHSDMEEFRQRKLSAHDCDLSSRHALTDEPDLIWYPAEVYTSIRPGWFYHALEDDWVRPLSELIHIYEHSVGDNATFLLNIPPNFFSAGYRDGCHLYQQQRGDKQTNV